MVSAAVALTNQITGRTPAIPVEPQTSGGVLKALQAPERSMVSAAVALADEITGRTTAIPVEPYLPERTAKLQEAH